LRPGEKLIKKLGGLHDFMRWGKPILTDSGGYQVFSLSQNKSKNKENSRSIKNLVKITEDGVEFKSHLDGSKHLFTPEKVIQIQLDLGVDILMPLDVCPSGKATREEVEEATRLTIVWAERAKKYFDKKTKGLPVKKRPLLHGIVQGGMFPDLRKECAEKLISMDFDGYSVGGLAVDFETRDMWKIVKLMGEILPKNKQRYLMGVGTPDDIIKATSLGMDMFDCVLPTRMARHGNVYVQEGEHYKLVNLLNSKYREDGGVIDVKCKCLACSGKFSKAYISHLIRSNEMLGLRLTTLHNLSQYLNLVQKMKKNI
jgi:queuine tRNA-ribosyltransferase